MILTGVLINAAAVAAGGVLGTLGRQAHAGKKCGRRCLALRRWFLISVST